MQAGIFPTIQTSCKKLKWFTMRTSYYQQDHSPPQASGRFLFSWVGAFLLRNIEMRTPMFKNIAWFAIFHSQARSVCVKLKYQVDTCVDWKGLHRMVAYVST